METTNNKYLDEMPYSERKYICDMLDQNDIWEVLAGSHMKFGVMDIKKFKNEIIRGNSPTDKLLNEWGRLNHTVLDLFILLGRMNQFEAMIVIKDLVDPQYHYLIKDRYTANKQTNNKHFGIPRENFNVNENKILNVNKVPKIQDIIIDSKDNNESLLADYHKQFLKPPKLKSPLPMSNLGNHSVSAISCVTESAGGIPHIPYEELRVATNNWDEVNNILGAGGFGKVFKGTWKCTQVAVKRIEQKENNPEWHQVQIKQTITELHCLNAYRHDNILPLYGYSICGLHPCLVYQYMAGGSLESRLKERDPERLLKWPTRRDIAIGTARGLQFLHTTGESGLVHGDIKSANILLDPCNVPRIGDFGLARKGPENDYTKVSKLQGTPPYLPEEFLRSRKFSTKVDTYSFGVVLFELATSMKAATRTDQKRIIYLRDHVMNYVGEILDLKDKNAPGHNECFLKLIEIGKECVDKMAKKRPAMVAVLLQLENVPI